MNILNFLDLVETPARYNGIEIYQDTKNGRELIYQCSYISEACIEQDIKMYLDDEVIYFGNTIDNELYIVLK